MSRQITKSQVITYLASQKLMSLATYGDHPWIASVYYSYDTNLHLYFLSSPETLHARHITNEPQVAVSIADSSQKISAAKIGLQMYGIAEQITQA